MQRIFIDMDGTIAEWNPDASLEEVAAKGYFRNLNPIKNVLEAIQNIIHSNNQYEVYILSSVFMDNHSKEEKIEWLKKYLPDVSLNYCLFVPYGENKSEYVSAYTGFLRNDDILLDDFSYNLHHWHGIGIKVLNGINGTKGTWNGYIVSAKQIPDIISNTIQGIILQKEIA